MPNARVATWNVWWRFGKWRERLPRIEQVLAAAAPDVVCLQETFVHDELDQPAHLAAHLGLEHHVHGSLVTQDGATFGNAILSRWPITRQAVHRLPSLGTYEEHRTVVVAELDAPKRKLVVATTHLNFRWEQSHVRQAQVEAICGVLGTWRPFETAPVLCGDLNADPHSDEVRMLTGRTRVPVEGIGFHCAWETAAADRFDPAAGVTWDRHNTNVSGHEPDRRIDHLLVGFPVDFHGAARTCERIGTEAIDGRHASDHYGLVATVQY